MRNIALLESLKDQEEEESGKDITQSLNDVVLRIMAESLKNLEAASTSRETSSKPRRGQRASKKK